MISWAAPRDRGLCLLAVGVVGDTLFVLLNDDALVVQWYLMVGELIPLCPHLSGGKATRADACDEVGCGYC